MHAHARKLLMVARGRRRPTLPPRHKERTESWAQMIREDEEMKGIPGAYGHDGVICLSKILTCLFWA